MSTLGRSNWNVWIAWSLAIALCVANALLHKPLSDLCDALYAHVGRVAYERLALVGIGTVCVAGAMAVRWRHRVRFPQVVVLRSLVPMAIITIAAQRWLLVSNIELIHLPQFAILATLILVASVPPSTVWLLATAAGVLDEIYQYVVIYSGVPNAYLDFNDMVLNAIGAAWPIVLWPAACGAERAALNRATTWPLGLPNQKAGRWTAAGSLLLLTAVLGWLDPPRIDALLQTAATGRMYHVFSAPEALVTGGVIWLLVLVLPSNRQAGNIEPTALAVPRWRPTERQRYKALSSPGGNEP